DFVAVALQKQVDNGGGRENSTAVVEPLQKQRGAAMTAKDPLRGRLTLTVAETAKIFGLGINATYAAVKSGEIPHVRIGGKIAVPVAPIRRMLQIEETGSVAVKGGGNKAA